MVEVGVVRSRTPAIWMAGITRCISAAHATAATSGFRSAIKIRGLVSPLLGPSIRDTEKLKKQVIVLTHDERLPHRIGE